MTQTNTDYLLQIAPAMTDRSYGVPAANDSAGKFDDHLSQAATTSLYDSQIRTGMQRTETARYERSDQSSNTNTSKQGNRDGDTSSRSQSSQPVQDEPSDVVSGSRPSENQSDCE